MAGKQTQSEQRGWSRSFRFDDDRSSKFWEITVAWDTVTTAWGRTGRMAQQRSRSFDSPDEAERFAARVIAEKTRKGYEERDHVRLERISERARTTAESLRFVGTDGGPLLVLPWELLPLWNGVYDDAGEYLFETTSCDYDRACEWHDLWVRRIGVGEGWGLVLHSDAAAAWLPRDDGGILVRWAAADAAAALAHAALTVPGRSWKGMGQRFEVGASGKIALFESTRRGAEIMALSGSELMEFGARFGLVINLAPGEYALHQIDSITGRLLDDRQPTDFSTELTRFRRSGNS